MPTFGPRGLTVVGVHAQAEAFNGVMLAQDNALCFDLVLDLEREALRSYRRAGVVFPLNIVLDPAGVLVHADNDAQLDTLTKALERLLPGPAAGANALP